jgi:N-acetylneuraminic acid mutarotase
MFKGLSKLLICGGYTHGSTTDTCEVISLHSSAITCKNTPKFPVTLKRAIGGLAFKETPIICGGEQNGTLSNRCYSLVNNQWVSSAGMRSVRDRAAVAQLQDGKLLVTGGLLNDYVILTTGLSESSTPLSSAEMLTEEGWKVNIPSLPVTFAGHCMVTVNSTTVMVIGGWQGHFYSGKTFYLNIREERWTEGPELKKERFFHTCGKIKRDKESQEMTIIVAGGENGAQYFTSVEILNEGSNEWQTGPELPLEVFEPQLIEDQNGGVFLIGGASIREDFSYIDTLYQLPYGGQDAVWTKMKQKLNTARRFYTAFLVPDNTVECS